MPMSLYKKIINEAATIPEIDALCLTGLSESLLDPLLEDRIKYAKEKIPQVKVDIYTNGTYLTPLKFEQLKAAGLDGLNISLNAGDAETRKKVMGLDDWEKVIANILYANSHKGEIKLEVKAVIDSKDFTAEDSEVLYRAFGWSKDGGIFQGVRGGNWAGERDDYMRDFKPNECCFRALWQIYVTVDGKVTTCCWDPLGKQVFGDLKEQGIKESYNSDAYVAFRQAHFEDRADQYDICAKCTRI